MVRKNQCNSSDDEKSDKSQTDEEFSALDCLAEVCLIYKPKKNLSDADDDRSKAAHTFPQQIKCEKKKTWSNFRGTCNRTQEPAPSMFIDNCIGKNNPDVNSTVTPSLFLSVRTEIKKGKNVNMDYMRSDRLWTICLRLDGAQYLKRLGFSELKAQGKKFCLIFSFIFYFTFLLMPFFPRFFCFFFFVVNFCFIYTFLYQFSFLFFEIASFLSSFMSSLIFLTNFSFLIF